MYESHEFVYEENLCGIKQHSFSLFSKDEGPAGPTRGALGPIPDFFGNSRNPGPGNNEPQNFGASEQTKNSWDPGSWDPGSGFLGSRFGFDSDLLVFDSLSYCN